MGVINYMKCKNMKKTEVRLHSGIGLTNIHPGKNKLKKHRSIFVIRIETNIFALPKSERQVLMTKWSVRLGVRTLGFHLSNRGSIPLRTTIKAF